MNRIFKGRTNNHLNWVMVDATDFATPESALSAATKIKIYGQLKAATGTNFVSSGTGSLTNDITHVGASATGQYHIALANADISDASAAFYDTYIVTLSATGAAYQTLICEGVQFESNLSDIVSNIYSATTALSDAVSNVYSAVLLTQSLASDAASAAIQANSRVLLTQSLASDAASAAIQANSRVLLVQSRVSDVQSTLIVMSSIQSDIYSALSDVSSRLGVMSGIQSDIYSLLAAVDDQTSNILVDTTALNDTSRAEPGQGEPSMTTTLPLKIDYMYKAWRNKTDQDAGKYKLYNDDGTTVGQSAVVSDDATTFTRGEVGTGA